MIIVRDLNLMLGGKLLFENVNCTLQAGQKIGLVGRNGAGKSTFLKVLSGMQSVDSGEVAIASKKKIGYMPQDVVMQSACSVFDEAMSVFIDFVKARNELVELEKSLELAISDDVLERYAELQDIVAHAGLSELELKARMILTGLGFSAVQLEQQVSALSLGWRMRLVLAKLLLQEADFYLFDEPTNHLDLVAKEWFIDFLKKASFGYLLVSHDRFFLDTVCDYVLELDRGKGTWYKGNYSAFLRQKEEAKERLMVAYDAQQKEIKRKMALVDRFRASANKAAMAQSLLKSLDKMERIEVESEAKEVKIKFGGVKRPGRVVLTAEQLAKSFNGVSIFANASFELFRDDKAALVAANGKGKSTLLNLVMNKLTKDAGSVAIGHGVEAALFEQDQAAVLDPKKTILEEIEAVCTTSEDRARVRAVLGTFLFPGDDVYKKTGVLSGGEKNRVAMVKVLLQHANLLILDEPTNHLDLESKEVLLKALQAYQGTILFVSHDRDFLNRLATKIFELTADGVVTYQGNYDAYLYYKQQKEQSLQKEAVVSVKNEQKESVVQKMPAAGGKNAYEIQKNIAKLERKIEKIEQELSDGELRYADLMYGTPEYLQHDKRMQILKNDLQQVTGEWESLQGQVWEQ